MAVIQNQCFCCPCCGECHCEEDGMSYYHSQNFDDESAAVEWVHFEMQNMKEKSLEGFVKKIGPRGGNLGRMYIETGTERNNYLR